MKKNLCILVMTVMVAVLSACGSSEGALAKKSLYEHGQDVIAMMLEMTRAEGYMEIYSSNEEILDVIEEIGKGDYEKPSAVYAVTADEKALFEEAGLAEMKVSEALQDSLESKLLGAMLTQLNSRSGVSTLAASSICTAGKTFVSQEITDHTIYLYIYEDATPIAIKFVAGEDNTVSADGMFLIYDELDEASIDSISELLGGAGVEITEVEQK